MILVDRKSGEPVAEGQYVTDRRGDSFKVTGTVEPDRRSPKGKVLVELDGIGDVPHDPGIFGLEFRLSATKGGKA